MPSLHRHAEWITEALAMRLAPPAAEPPSGSLSQRLYAALREWIQQGSLPAASALPSSRRLAADLGIGRNTVLAAMDRLVAEGFVEARPGAGLFVASLALPEPSPLPGAPIQASRWHSRRGQRLLESCGEMEGSRDAFAPGVPALDLFPREAWQRLLRRHRHQASLDAFGYATSGGHHALKTALCDYLRLSRSVNCQPHQILITQGAQQGFELIARLLADPGDSVWVEDPGYAGAKACFNMAGLTPVPVPVDAQGMQPEALAPDSPPPRLIYVTPSHQYPCGVTMPVARRLALLDFARHHGALIIEDDYDSEFRYTTAPVASLQGLAGGGPVLYVGTFSKVLYPGLRLGYLVLPEALVDDFRRANARLHREGQYVSQSALADFIVEGHFSRHIARMRHCYRQRQACLREALAPAVEQGLELSAGQAGMHLVARLASRAQEQRLIERGRREGVTLSPLSGHYLAPDAMPGLVLGYAGSTPERIAEAGGWLARSWIDDRQHQPAG